MPRRRLFWIYLCCVSLLVCLVTLASAQDTTATEDIEDDTEEVGEDKKGTRPRGLTAEVLNATTISLTWKHPKIATEECPVKRYVLRLKQDGARRSRAWKVDGERGALGLHNLKPETLYSIRMVAITCAGKGKPSKWIEVKTQDISRRRDEKKGSGKGDIRTPREEPSGIENRPPGRPTYVRTRTFPDSVVLSWQAPTEAEIVVRGYMVGYGEGVPDVNWQYVGADQRNVTIQNLKPSTQYIISLRAFNNQGKGPTVYDMIYTRALSGPTIDPTSIQTPENLRAKVLSPTNVWLQWRDPSLDRAQQITDDRYYNVHYKSLPEGEKLSVVVKALHVVLYELTPGTEYEFKVRTVKDSFYSEFSDSITNRTYETAPGSTPRSVSVSPANSTTSVVISWKFPKQANGKIKGYLVLHSNDRLRPIAEWNAIATSEVNAVVEGLEPGQTYYFKVQARNGVGYGPLSKTAAFTIPTESSNNPGQQSVAVPVSENVNVTEEVLESQPIASGSQPQNSSDPLEHSGSVLEAGSSSKNQDTNTLLEVTPAPLTANALPQKSKPIKSEVEFAAKVLHTISAFITWPSKPPNCVCDAENMQYIFHLYMRGQEEQPHMRQLQTNVVHLEDLDPNETYHYQVKYIFPNGTETAWSQEQALDTDCRGSPSNINN